MTNSEFKFFYDGIFYKTQEEFEVAVQNFNCSPFTPESFNRMMSWLERDILLNTDIRKREITNSEMREIIEKMFLLFLEEMNKLIEAKEILKNS